jgi:hypothetical protein
MARFSGIPAVPLEGADPNLTRVLMSLKENVELLTGQRNEFDGASIAIVSGQVTTPYSEGQITTLSARGAGLQLTEGAVPQFEDYIKLLKDVQTLVNDVASLRNTVNLLIAQLRDDT